MGYLRPTKIIGGLQHEAPHWQRPAEFWNQVREICGQPRYQLSYVDTPPPIWNTQNNSYYYYYYCYYYYFNINTKLDVAVSKSEVIRVIQTVGIPDIITSSKESIGYKMNVEIWVNIDNINVGYKRRRLTILSYVR